MENEFPNLRSFQHCRKDVDLVCFQLPERCPLCGHETWMQCRVPPFVLPSPLTSSVKVPRSVVLKPTNGDFLRNYSTTCNLHIGVTDEKGLVYDFDENGLHERSVWPECLVVLSCVNSLTHAWDYSLSVFVQQAVWDASRYRDDNWNCFDFVFQFLHHVGHPDVSSVNYRADFCDRFISDKQKQVEGYVKLFREAERTGCVVVCKKGSGT